MPIGLRQTVAPTAEPLTLAEAKQHLRVDGGYDDALVSRLVTAAREYAERETRRQLMPATYRLTLDYFPGRFWVTQYEALPRERAWEYGRYFRDRALLLPRPPLQSVSAVTYVDTSGATQTLDPALYLVDAESEPGRLAPAYNQQWPSVQERVNTVQVTYVAGYASAALVPSSVKLAMLLLVGSWFEHREAADAGGLAPVPMAVDALLAHESVPSIF
jgi:uncharacterized phiE125 gp8 family phage protein